MNQMSEIAEKLHRLIPGGAHTYSKGDDQWPEVAPKYLVRGKGCLVWDGQNKEYIDWAMGLSSVCLGHANEEVNKAAIDGMALGHNFQRPALIEALAAEAFLDFLEDRGEMVKFAKNGSTVTTAAVKLARAFTGREKIAICSDHPFFSYDDWFIGATKVWAGIPQAIQDLTVKFKYNDVQSLEQMFKKNPGEISCLILEPIKFEKPKPEFLAAIQTLCKKYGIILIADEMVSGFKWHNQGAAKYYNLNADLYTWGKGMANGHSVCALTGRRDIMELGGIHHSKPRVFLSSTTHGAEIPQLAAMIKVLEIFKRNPQPISENWKKGAEIKKSLTSIIQKHKLSEVLQIVGDDCLFFLNFKTGGKHNLPIARTFFLQECVKRNLLFQGGFYPTPAHDVASIDRTYDVFDKVLPVYSRFIEDGKREELIGEPTRPVFRAFNSCLCLTPEDCQKCAEKMKK